MARPADGKKLDLEQLRERADHNYPDAHAELGRYLVEHCGGEEEREEGLAWIKKAIDNDHVEATMALARWSRQGSYGVEKNLRRAAKCFNEAAKLGSVESRVQVRVQRRTRRRHRKLGARR